MPHSGFLSYRYTTIIWERDVGEGGEDEGIYDGGSSGGGSAGGSADDDDDGGGGGGSGS